MLHRSTYLWQYESRMSAVTFAAVLQSILEEDCLSQASKPVYLVRILHCHSQFPPPASKDHAHTRIYKGCLSTSTKCAFFAQVNCLRFLKLSQDTFCRHEIALPKKLDVIES